jgi:hypothetical protein
MYAISSEDTDFYVKHIAQIKGSIKHISNTYGGMMQIKTNYESVEKVYN